MLGWMKPAIMLNDINVNVNVVHLYIIIIIIINRLNRLLLSHHI